MNTKSTYTATAPDGTTLTAKSVRPYTHAVIGKNSAGDWKFARFSSSPALAFQTKREWEKNAQGELLIVEVSR